MVPNLATPTGALEALTSILAQEQQHYEQLLALANRQGQLMTSHDLDGLQTNARELSQGLAAAQAVRLQREKLASEMMQGAGSKEANSLSVWLHEQPATVQEVLMEPVQAVRRTAGELARTNEMNRRLANFCLDLVEEEAALLRRCLLADPAGCYDRGAQPTQNEMGGVLKRQA